MGKTLEKLPHKPFGTTYFLSDNIKPEGSELKVKLVDDISPDDLIAVSTLKDTSPYRDITGYCLWSEVLGGEVTVTVNKYGRSTIIIQDSTSGVNYKCHIFGCKSRGFNYKEYSTPDRVELPVVILELT